MFLHIAFLLSFIGVQGTDPILIKSNEKRTSNFRGVDQSQRNSEIVLNDLELNILADGPSWEILNYEGHSQSIEVPNNANWIEVIAYGASGETDKYVNSLFVKFFVRRGLYRKPLSCCSRILWW
jgi:hypothetical protein